MHVLLIHNHFKTEEHMIMGNYSNGRSRGGHGLVWDEN